MTQSSARKRFKQFGRSVTRSMAGYARDFGKNVADHAQDLGARFDAYQFRMRDMVPVSKYMLGLGTMTAVGGAVAAPKVTVAPVKQTDVPSMAVDAAIAERHAAKMQMAETISDFYYGAGLTTDALTDVSEKIAEAESSDAIQDAVLDVAGDFPDDATRIMHTLEQNPDLHAQIFAKVWQQQQEAVGPIAVKSKHGFLPVLGHGIKALVTSHSGKRMHPIYRRVLPHKGVDIVPAAGEVEGASVFMPFEKGVVTKIESRAGKLNKISIESAEGVTVTFMHVRPDADLRVGQQLDVNKEPTGKKKVAQIGKKDRWSTRPHLHMEIHDARGKNITAAMQYQFLGGGDLKDISRVSSTARAMHPDVLGYMRNNLKADACVWDKFKADQRLSYENGKLSKEDYDHQQKTFVQVDAALIEAAQESADLIEVHGYYDLQKVGAVFDSTLFLSAAEIIALQADADKKAYHEELEKNPPKKIVFDVQLDENGDGIQPVPDGTGKDVEIDYVPDEVESDVPNLFDVNREIIQKQEADRMLDMILQAKKNGVFATAKTEQKTTEQLRADALNFARLVPQS